MSNLVFSEEVRSSLTPSITAVIRRTQANSELGFSCIDKRTEAGRASPDKNREKLIKDSTSKHSLTAVEFPFVVANCGAGIRLHVSCSPFHTQKSLFEIICNYNIVYRAVILSLS